MGDCSICTGCWEGLECSSINFLNLYPSYISSIIPQYICSILIYKFDIVRNLPRQADKQSGSGHTIYFLNEWPTAVSAQDAGKGLSVPQNNIFPQYFPNISLIIPQYFLNIFPKYFHNNSSIFPQYISAMIGWMQYLHRVECSSDGRKQKSCMKQTFYSIHKSLRQYNKILLPKLLDCLRQCSRFFDMINFPSFILVACLVFLAVT